MIIRAVRLVILGKLQLVWRRPTPSSFSMGMLCNVSVSLGLTSRGPSCRAPSRTWPSVQSGILLWSAPDLSGAHIT